jgi:hypothetical protein
MPNHLCEMTSCRKPLPGAAADGVRLCPSCRASVRGALLSLPGLHEECAEVLTAARQQPWQRVGGRTPRGAPPGIGLNEQVVAARADVLGLLSSWAALVAEERPGRPPGGREVPVLVAHLHSALDWLLAHPAAGDFAEETVAVAGRLRRVLDLRPVRHWDLGPCTAPDCGLAARAVAREGERPEVRCDAGHTVRPEQWLLMEVPRSAGRAASTAVTRS